MADQVCVNFTEGYDSLIEYYLQRHDFEMALIGVCDCCDYDQNCLMLVGCVDLSGL